MPRRAQPSPERDDKAAQFATALAEALHGLKLTHKKLAEALGITLHSVDSWTRANHPNLPGEENLRKLCDLLDARQAGLGQRLSAILNPQRSLPTTTASPRQSSPDSAHSNLRVPATSFIGRRSELAEIVALMSGINSEPCRLLTLLGPGGIGKTRLAIQAATELVAEFEDGLWWVELANISEPGLIWQALASILEVREEPGRAIAESVVQRLHRKHILLILDNSEHLTAACAALCERLLRECPALQILITTRESLQLSGEKVMALATLSLPPLDVGYRAKGVGREATDTPHASRPTPHAAVRRSLSQYDGTRLFIERAFFQQRGFAVNEANAPTIIEICHRLDGIALAIELAAACLPQLSIAQISERLHDRFNILTRGSQTVLPRHQTLRATIAWSYDLLTPAEQAVFAKLAVFQGGWPIEAAQAIAHDGAPINLSLAQFNNKSLIVLEERDGCLRYRMLESIGEYTRERLRETAGQEALFQKHAHYFAQWVELQQHDLTGAQQQRTLALIESDHDNLRAALTWTRQHQSNLNLRLCAALWRFWLVRGYLSEGRGHLAWALAHTTDQISLQRAAVLNGAGALARQQLDYELAYAFYTQSLGMYRQLDDAAGVAQVLNDLGIVVTSRGDHAQARELYQESAALWRKLGHFPGVAASVLGLSLIAYSAHDYAAARKFCEESLAMARQADDPLSTLRALNALGEVARTQADFAQAERCYRESRQLSETLGHRWGNAAALHNLGYVEKHLGKLTEAAQCFQQSLLLYQELEDQRGIAECLCGFGVVQIGSGRYADGLRVLAAAQTLLQQAEAGLTQTEQAEFDTALDMAKAHLDQAHYQSIWAAGQALSLREAAVLAVNHPS